MITQYFTAQVHASTPGLYDYFIHKLSNFYIENLRITPVPMLITQIENV